MAGPPRLQFARQIEIEDLDADSIAGTERLLRNAPQVISQLRQDRIALALMGQVTVGRGVGVSIRIDKRDLDCKRANPWGHKRQPRTPNNGSKRFHFCLRREEPAGNDAPG